MTQFRFNSIDVNIIQFFSFLLGILLVVPVNADLADTIERNRPSVVGVGTVQKTRAPQLQLRGTGFVVADGLHVVTNAHVLPTKLQSSKGEVLTVLAGRGSRPEIRRAVIVTIDERHDLAVLKVQGRPLPSLRLGDSSKVREGENYAFTGFPIGAVLGLYPVTHKGMISSITPIVTPANHGSQLNAKQIKRLRSPYNVLQLDATAYPGNSGSPLYATDTGEVVGVINMVFVKETKENILSKPSGITYAIPVKYLRSLLQEAGLLLDDDE